MSEKITDNIIPIKNNHLKVGNSAKTANPTVIMKPEEDKIPVIKCFSSFLRLSFTAFVYNLYITQKTRTNRHNPTIKYYL